MACILTPRSRFEPVAAGDIYGMMDFHTGGDSEVEEAQGPAAAPNIEGLHILDPQDITCRVSF